MTTRRFTLAELSTGRKIDDCIRREMSHEKGRVLKSACWKTKRWRNLKSMPEALAVACDLFLCVMPAPDNFFVECALK